MKKMKEDIKHLYIIGNGFDKFTGLKSSYVDFRWWLENNYIFVYEALTSIYDSSGEWWNDFESQLGKLDIQRYILDFTPKYDSVSDLTSRISERRRFEKDNGLPHNVLFSNPCSSRLKGLLDILQYCFEKWVQSVQKSIINPKYTYLEHDNSFFINFNYTDTLVWLYGIPEERILHIHGRASKHEHLIFGHNCHLFGTRQTGHEGEMVSEVLNSYEKNPYNNIPNDLSEIIKNVEHIHVLGFSFSIVDNPYLEWIICNTKHTCDWEISWYSDRDKSRIKDFLMDNPRLIDRKKLIQIRDIKIPSNFNLSQ